MRAYARWVSQQQKSQTFLDMGTGSAIFLGMRTLAWTVVCVWGLEYTERVKKSLKNIIQKTRVSDKGVIGVSKQVVPLSQNL